MEAELAHTHVGCFILFVNREERLLRQKLVNISTSLWRSVFRMEVVATMRKPATGSVRTEITEKLPRQLEHSPLAFRLMLLLVSVFVKRQDAGEKPVVVAEEKRAPS